MNTDGDKPSVDSTFTLTNHNHETSMPPNNNNTPDYGAVDNAQILNRYPWMTENGAHIVTFESWTGRKTVKHGFADFLELRVVKTLVGDASAVGSRRTRMRPWGQHGALDEVRTRAYTAMSAVAKANGGSAPSQAEINGSVLQGIHASAGDMFVGYPIKIEVANIKTRGGNDFTTIAWSLPTATDLEGVALDQTGRVVS